MESPRPLTTPSLLGIALGLAVLAAVTLSFLRRGVEELSIEEARDLLHARFEVGEVPGGLELSGGHRFAGGQIELDFAGGVDLAAGGRRQDPSEEPPASDGMAVSSRETGSGHPEHVDWEQLPEGEPGRPPAQATLVLVPGRKRAHAFLQQQFSKLRYKDIGRVSSRGEVLPMESGKLDWQGFLATWVRLRHYEFDSEGIPTFHDTLRVNLTTGDEARVLYLRWERGLPGGVSAAQAWLDALEPRS